MQLLSMFYLYGSEKRFPFPLDPPANVSGLHIEERKNNSTKITWNNLAFGNCKPKYRFNLLFKSKNASLFNDTTSNTFFNCDWRCEHATMLEIWPVVDGVSWNVKKLHLEKIDESEFLQ